MPAHCDLCRKPLEGNPPFPAYCSDRCRTAAEADYGEAAEFLRGRVEDLTPGNHLALDPDTLDQDDTTTTRAAKPYRSGSPPGRAFPVEGYFRPFD